MPQINVPLVAREEASTKNCKMMLTIGFAIIVIVVLVGTIRDPVSNVEAMSDIANNTYTEATTGEFYTTNAVKGQYIVLYNINKAKLPVTKIVAIDVNRQIHPISRKNATITMHGTGTRMVFDLKKEMTLSQIVIDINVFCAARQNMQTTMVEVHDKDHTTVWHSTKPLTVDSRYISVYIQEPRIIQGEPQQVLCNGLPTCGEENILNSFLQQNVWDETIIN
jgi:hypothetical protein